MDIKEYTKYRRRVEGLIEQKDKARWSIRVTAIHIMNALGIVTEHYKSLPGYLPNMGKMRLVWEISPHALGHTTQEFKAEHWGVCPECGHFTLRVINHLGNLQYHCGYACKSWKRRG